MFKNIYFHCISVLLHYLYLVLIIRDVFLEYDKDYVVILVYISSKTSYFRHVLLFEYAFDIISISKNCSRFHEVQGGSFFSNLPRVIKPLRNVTLLLVVTGAPYMTQLISRHLETFC